MRFSHLIILVLGLLFSCDKGIEPLPLGKRLEVIVITEKGDLVEGATVNVFANQSDFIFQRKTLVDSIVTQNNGTAEFYGIPELATDAYVSVEKGNMNNWGGIVRVILLGESTRVVITVRASLANRIAGRFSKRWRQVRQVYNGTEFRVPCDFFQLIHTFKRDNFMRRTIAADCSLFGVEQDLPQGGSGEIFWQINAQNTGLIIGSPSNLTTYKVCTILELSETRLRYVYKPANDLDSPITVEEEFVAIP